jgi:hypothetical protein
MIMLKSLLRGSLSVLKWVLCGVGAMAVLLTALVATPLKRPPELQSVSAARGAVDFSALPAIERFQARDGTALGFRHYPSNGPATGRGAIVVHGSSGSSGGTIHVLSAALAGRGVETWAVDIRGHGASGTRGDIGHVGQLEDDLADFVAIVRKTAPTTPLTLIGHSSASRARRFRNCSRAPCCSPPISAMTRRPAGPLRAAGPMPMSRASLG